MSEERREKKSNCWNERPRETKDLKKLRHDSVPSQQHKHREQQETITTSNATNEERAADAFRATREQTTTRVFRHGFGRKKGNERKGWG